MNNILNFIFVKAEYVPGKYSYLAGLLSRVKQRIDEYNVNEISAVIAIEADPLDERNMHMQKILKPNDRTYFWSKCKACGSLYY